MSNINITMNAEKNGIELRFNAKPDGAIMDMLKMNGFKWSNRQKMWYARQNEKTIGVANSLNADGANFFSVENKTKKYLGLWELTRTDGIENHVDKSKHTKEMAMEIRQHIKQRFPMCKFSITSDYNSIDAEIKASPFEKESDELEAIRDYVTGYIFSYKYCIEYDPYGDYGSSYNFYFSKCDISWDYKQTEMSVSIANMCEDFQKDKAVFEAAARERFLKECEERAKREAIERAKAEEQRKVEEAMINSIQASVTIKDVDYFCRDLVDPCYSKLNTAEEYKECEDAKRYVCKVSKEVHMNKEQYDFFASHFMEDWDFVNGTGGSNTDDWRINSMLDYDMMNAEERKTVEWYSDNCVAIFCDGVPMCVVDAQGYSYCRYVYFFDDVTMFEGGHESEQVITEAENEAFKNSAEVLIDVSAKVIEDNQLMQTWKEDGFGTYKKALKEYICDHNISLNTDMIRAIDGDYEDVKRAYYYVYTEMNKIQAQFKRAGLKNGQRITIIQMDCMIGGVHMTRATFDSFKCERYAQYEDAVELIIRPENKRRLYRMNIYGDVLVYDGWLENVSEDLFYETISRDNGVVVRKGKYSSFDSRQYNVVFDYYKKLGKLPLIDKRK